MDLDAISLGLHDHEMRLLRSIAKVLYLPNILYVGFLGKIIYTSSSKNCFIGQTKKTGNSGKDRLDHKKETTVRPAYGFKQICEQGE